MTDKEILDAIKKLIEENPNNYELGDKVRKLYWNNVIEIKK
jgi:hypothetical protein